MADKPTADKLPPIAFVKAIESVISPEVQRVAAGTNASLTDETINDLLVAFEFAARHDREGNELWDARDLARLLDYSDYRNFLNIVEKAKDSSKTAGIAIEHHFVDATDMVDIGSGAVREVKTLLLSRYACYLIAQNGDPRKRPIAFAQTYFAVQARRQEVQDQSAAASTEDEKRLLLRHEIKEHNKKLASAAKAAGVVLPLDFAIFQNSGYQGLYGGLDKRGIERRKGVKGDILDHMGSTELAANLFRATQTEEKLRRDSVRGKEAANLTHRQVGAQVRAAIKEIGGTMPEDLPPAENIVKVGRRLKAAIESSSKASQ
ncbi:DNA damage-inducible protein D [Bradyrhizobium yuanmingense]|uniref:DNA damage-inducible protein D n=1 Tax=Bradyrhizobium yuanmingense TaxID=108015 RepID=UPI0023B94DD3|nr:DNA damage-inducible protein D [Bradyrhizobium yuanmingense]MDF0496175.1 DNA damage-inducible protein D [Bradyrhizobium yuanmingense]